MPDSEDSPPAKSLRKFGRIRSRSLLPELPDPSSGSEPGAPAESPDEIIKEHLSGENLVGCFATLIHRFIGREGWGDPEEFDSVFSETRFMIEDPPGPKSGGESGGEPPEDPGREKIAAWVDRARRIGGISQESLVLAARYFREAFSGRQVSQDTWRWASLTCMILGCKVWEDQAVELREFYWTVPGSDPNGMVQMEARLLGILDYDVNVSASEYAREYFDLRETEVEILDADQVEKIRKNSMKFRKDDTEFRTRSWHGQVAATQN